MRECAIKLSDVLIYNLYIQFLIDPVFLDVQPLTEALQLYHWTKHHETVYQAVDIPNIYKVVSIWDIVRGEPTIGRLQTVAHHLLAELQGGEYSLFDAI